MLTAPQSLVRACRRLNPAVALDVDILAVQSAALASTKDDWSAGTLTNTQVDAGGAVRLAESGSRDLFNSGGTSAGATDKYHWFNVANLNGTETTWFDFWPDPSVIGPNGFTLHSLDLVLGRKDTVVFGNPGPTNAPKSAGSKYVLTVARLDANWNREVLGDPIYLDATAVPTAGGLVTVNFRTQGRTITVRTGQLRTRTGSGLSNTGERTQDFVFDGDAKVSRLTVPLGFSVGVSVFGAFPQGAWLGMVPTATLAAFDTSTFWRHSTGSNARDCGPFSPDAKGPSPLDPTQNPGYQTLSTGAVPGFGAASTAQLTGGTPNGQWGVARQVGTPGKPQTGASQEPHGWQRPYHVLRGVTYATSGTALVVLDLGRVPVNEVHFRADTAEPTGTAVTFSLRGRNLITDAWTAIGAVVDGAVLPVGQRFRYYEVTATLAGTSDTLATPVLQAASVTERIRFATFPYMGDVDSTATIDPVTGQSEIGELKLPLLKAGPKDFRDIVTSIASDYAASSIEAWVYVRETVTGTRHFLNLYRLENREPALGEEDLTFMAGLDRLKVTIPPTVTTYIYPVDGSEGVLTSVSYNSTTKQATLGVASTPFAAVNVAKMRYEGITGALTGTNWYIASAPAPTDHTFVIVLEDDAQAPAVGDHFRIHSDVTTRAEVTYSEDFASIYADILANQAAVPQRFRGALPATTGRTGGSTLTADGAAAIDVLQDIGIHCGGSFQWVRGRISFGDLYGPHDVVDTWNERDFVDLKTPTGQDRRMPSVNVKYGYDVAQGSFNNEATFDDRDALLALGRANLFDIAELPDALCKWNPDVNEAQYLAGIMLGAWSTGVRLWIVTVATPRPWLDYFDAVAISTDQYTDRRSAYAADGVTDNGSPVRGRVSAVGIIVAKNLLGTEFTLAIRGLSGITSAVPTSGTVEAPAAPFAVPTLDLSPTTSATQYSIAFTSTGTVQVKTGAGSYGAAVSPVVVARNAIGGADKVVTFEATLNGQTVYNTVTVPAQVAPNNTFGTPGQFPTYNTSPTPDVVALAWAWNGDTSAVFDLYIEENATGSTPAAYTLNGASPIAAGTTFHNYSPLADIDPVGTLGRKANIGFYVVARFGGTTVTSDRLEVVYNRN